MKSYKQHNISLIVPCYNEESNIPKFILEIQSIALEIKGYVNLNVIFVNDGSSDNTIQVIRDALSKVRDINISVIDLSRNYGKEIAVLAGLDHFNGEAAIIIDADLQHPIEYIPKFISLWRQGYETVVAVQESRATEPITVRWFKTTFYKVFTLLSERPLKNGAGDFRLMDKKVVTAFCKYRESLRFNKGIYEDIGFSVKYIPYTVASRHGGVTKWSMIKLFKYAFNGIFSFSTIPLDIIMITGLFLFIISILILAYTLFNYFVFSEPVRGYTTLVSIMSLYFGLLILFIGIIGKYIGILFRETKKRPVYLIKNEFKNNG